jgi:hypothetical protein
MYRRQLRNPSRNHRLAILCHCHFAIPCHFATIAIGTGRLVIEELERDLAFFAHI